MLVALLLLYTNRGKNLQERIKEYFWGAYIPEGNIYGIDVSHFQGVIHWEDVENIKYEKITHRIGLGDDSSSFKPVSFAIAKATEGSNGKYDDKDYETNYKGIRNTKMKLGAYHVLTPGGQFDQQARHFIEVSKLETGDIRPILDIEADIRLKGKDLREAVKQWAGIVEKYYGCKPIIYTSTVLYATEFANADFGGYDFWIAQYYNSVLKVKASIWQFTSRGKIDGISGKVDLNVLPNGVATLEHLLIP